MVSQTELELKETKSSGEYSLTYVGHATTLINMDNTFFLTDPVFSDRIFGNLVRRQHAPGVNLNDISPDAVLISHDHPDHWDEEALRYLAQRQIPIVSSQNLKRKLINLGFTDIRELDPWQQTDIKGVTVYAVPAAHAFSNSCGFVLKDDQKTIYFPGDTGLFKGMSQLKPFDIDVALLPIGDSRPSLSPLLPGLEHWTRQHRHMGPADIPAALELLDAKTAIPIHHGVFRMTIYPPNAPGMEMEAIIEEQELEGRVRILEPGESIAF